MDAPSQLPTYSDRPSATHLTQSPLGLRNILTGRERNSPGGDAAARNARGGEIPRSASAPAVPSPPTPTTQPLTRPALLPIANYPPPQGQRADCIVAAAGP